MIVAFGGTSPPDGWLLCDGSAVSRTAHAPLFAVIGTQWGIGDGATTFNVPDLRGRFLRGVNMGSGHDPDDSSGGAASGGPDPTSMSTWTTATEGGPERRPIDAHVDWIIKT